jgi:phage replication-related protein YjqB (UPF0714/DUF867 family)
VDRYRSFQELARDHQEGLAWEMEYVFRGSRILVMAPHGGWIEPFTCQLAALLAGEDLSLYTFRGVGSPGGGSLHLTSHRFDEPTALRAAREAERVVAIHGERTRDRPFVMVGGLWDRFRREMAGGLVSGGFPVEPPRPGLGGRNPRNICNRGSCGGGGQLEISEGLRRSLLRDEALRGAFVEAVRGVLLELESGRGTRQET